MRLIKGANVKAKISPDELDILEEAMIALGQELAKSDPQANSGKLSMISNTLVKLNTIRKSSRVDAIEITPAHGG